MSDFEAIIDKRIQQAVDYYESSDTYGKLACFAAVQVVGRYSDATEQIAKRTKRSVSTVQNWAHAAKLYQELRRDGQSKLARQLWRKLPASHWWLAHDIQRAGYDALYYLLGAATYSWSGRDMLKEFDTDLKAGNAPLQFYRMRLSFYGLALELMKRVGELTAAQAVAVDAVRKAFQS